MTSAGIKRIIAEQLGRDTTRRQMGWVYHNVLTPIGDHQDDWELAVSDAIDKCTIPAEECPEWPCNTCLNLPACTQAPKGTVRCR